MRLNSPITSAFKSEASPGSYPAHFPTTQNTREAKVRCFLHRKPQHRPRGRISVAVYLLAHRDCWSFRQSQPTFLKSKRCAMPEPTPADSVWLYDCINHYRLNQDIINKFLREKWGNYQFFIEAGARLTLRHKPFFLTSRSLPAIRIDSGFLESLPTYVSYLVILVITGQKVHTDSYAATVRAGRSSRSTYAQPTEVKAKKEHIG